MVFDRLVRTLNSRRLVRPWALCAPIVILLISIPLLRPLRSPDRRTLSDEEEARLATVQAIVEDHTLAIDDTDFRDTRAKIVAKSERNDAFPLHTYSNQPPMLAVLLSSPYWALHKCGVTLSRRPNAVIFWLTLLGITLPVALSAGLVYRMGRIFELNRPKRAALALIVVIASGLISYCTVLNAHAPAAALLLASAACLIHVITHRSPRSAAGWLMLAGLCSALAATIDPAALVFLVLFLLVIAAFHWSITIRLLGAVMYLIGTALPIAIHAELTRPITGDLRAGLFHPELTSAGGRSKRIGETEKHGGTAPASALYTPVPAVAPSLPLSVSPSPTALTIHDDDDEPQSAWASLLRNARHVLGVFIGRHGVFSHFPVMLMGIIGVSLIMHRHWPTATKMLAGTTLGGALTVMLVYALCRTSSRDAMFATRWFIVFLPLTLFWSGAWLRRSHRKSSWIMAGTLLAFSIIVSLIGATGPFPRNGFDHYSVTGAWHNLIHPDNPSASLVSPVVSVEE